MTRCHVLKTKGKKRVVIRQSYIEYTSIDPDIENTGLVDGKYCRSIEIIKVYKFLFYFSMTLGYHDY